MSKTKDMMIDLGIGLPGIGELLVGAVEDPDDGTFDFYVWTKDPMSRQCTMINRIHEADLGAEGEHPLILAAMVGLGVPGCNSITIGGIDGCRVTLGGYRGFMVEEKGSVPAEVWARLTEIVGGEG